MAQTTHRQYPLPDTEADIDEEFYRLANVTLPKIDLDMHSLFEAIGGKADSDHRHGIAEIEDLQQALDSKMAADRVFSLSDIGEFTGFEAAPDGYIPVKVGDRIVFQSGLSALGEHHHPVREVDGLEDALDDKADKSNFWSGTQAQYDALPEKVAGRYYFII
ncbi:MAG: hypothetical protein P0Y65_20725 [Candidatus Devosia phytovorans]|uniref:Minor tail protein gp31 C-terminal domain-containing protein n=1 Tax=Candidatus Devosia phytovorans TaxID=3121372 RepID=A0AAJ6AZW5_9HYPH|nr:hypothetical protein [Devosia sp.]WEK04567.1 MAG: hypothetical protein P0Y65_20725 [Devosia sp.]